VPPGSRARADVLAGGAADGRTVPGEPEEVVTLVEGEVQSLSHRRDHLLDGCGPGSRSIRA